MLTPEKQQGMREVILLMVEKDLSFPEFLEYLDVKSKEYEAKEKKKNGNIKDN